MPTNNALDKLKEFIERCNNFLRRKMNDSYDPHNTKKLDRLFKPVEAAAMVGRDRSTLIKAEALLGMELSRQPGNNRREGYDLAQVQKFREHFGTLPWRDPTTDPCLVISFQNFKGGVGKSTNCLHMAHGMALKGYRVLMVDADHQATTTSMFGYLPDKDLTQADTFLPYLNGEQPDLKYAVRATHWPNIDLIPACMQLSDAEIGIVVHLTEISPAKRIEFFRELRFGLETIMSNYDFILIDSPPSNGMVALSVLMAADCVVVPSAPEMPDFTSTVQFITMIEGYINQIDPEKDIRWIKVLPSRFDARVRSRYGGHEDFLGAMRSNLGDLVFDRVINRRAAISNAAGDFRTLYESPDLMRKDPETVEMLNGVVKEIETLIWREWPSKRGKLINEGIV